MKTVNTEHAPQINAPNSQAVMTWSRYLVSTSGQMGIDPKTDEMVEGEIEGQTSQAIKNLQAVLEKAGSKLNMITKTTVYLTDMNDAEKMKEIYAKYIRHEPAGSIVGVSKLSEEGAIIMIEATALFDKRAPI